MNTAERRRVHLWFLILVGLWAIIGTAHAFELERLDGDPCSAAQNLFWGASEATYSVESLDDISATLTREEATAWTERTPFRFVEGTQVSFCSQDDGNIVSVGFADRLCDGAEFPEDALAVTVTYYSAPRGELAAAEVIFNTAEDALADEATFRHVALHELGHVLGLDHSDACGENGDGTVMKGVLRTGDPRLRVPSQDDIDGVSFIYGDGVPGPPPASSDSGCSLKPDARARPLGWSLVAAAFLGSAIRRASRAWRAPAARRPPLPASAALT